MFGIDYVEKVGCCGQNLLCSSPLEVSCEKPHGSKNSQRADVNGFDPVSFRAALWRGEKK